jgi:hypothetical protein
VSTIVGIRSRSRPPRRASTQQLIHLLRAELWGDAIDAHPTYFTHFATHHRTSTNSPKCHLPLASAVLYAVN